MTGKGLPLPLKGSNSHANYDFLNPSGPIYLPTKYGNFAHSPFNCKVKIELGLNSWLLPGMYPLYLYCNTKENVKSKDLFGFLYYNSEEHSSSI